MQTLEEAIREFTAMDLTKVKGQKDFLNKLDHMRDRAGRFKEIGLEVMNSTLAAKVLLDLYTGPLAACYRDVGLPWDDKFMDMLSVNSMKIFAHGIAIGIAMERTE